MVQEYSVLAMTIAIATYKLFEYNSTKLQFTTDFDTRILHVEINGFVSEIFYDILFLFRKDWECCLRFDTRGAANNRNPGVHRADWSIE